MFPLVSGMKAPRQRNKREENKQIKEGQLPEQWDENPNKKRQKDVDAKWTKKNNELHYVYKNHAKVDNKYKFIEKGIATDASVHGSQALDDLLDEKDKVQSLWADSANSRKDQETTVKKDKSSTKSMKRDRKIIR